MSVNTKMTAIADEIRELAGGTEKLTLDAMAANVNESNNEIAVQKELLEQAITALNGKVAPDVYERGYADGYADGEKSFHPIEDGLLAKTLTEYRNTRPVTIGNRFFSYFYDLVSVDLPNAVAIVQYAFVYCTSLPKIVLPSVETLEAFVFQDCSSLTVVDLHKVNALQSNVFTRTNLTTLILRKTDGITNNGSTAVFNSTPISRGEGFIYVPAALVDTYKAATNWSVYAAQIRAIEDYPEITGG